MLSRRRSGTTLIEVLMVIAVIALLVSALFAAISRIRERTRRSRTEELLEKVASGLEVYKLRFNRYPPAQAGALTGNEALAYYLTSAFRVAPVLAKGQVQATTDVGPITELKDDEILGGKIVDSWGKPLSYDCLLIDDAQQAEKLKIVNTEGQSTIVKRWNYKLYSFGPNRLDDGGTGDDLTTKN